MLDPGAFIFQVIVGIFVLFAFMGAPLSQTAQRLGFDLIDFHYIILDMFLFFP